MVNIAEIIETIWKETHLRMVRDVFGDEGVDAAFQVMETVKSLYKHVEPERVSGRLIIYRVVHPHDAAPIPPPIGPAADFATFANLPIDDLILEVASDGRPYRRTVPDATAEELARNAVVYHWRAGQEEFLAGDDRKAVPRFDQAARSQFAVPTFADLREALQRYATENVRESTCYIFRRAWYDRNRLFLKAEPEGIMRDSLTLFLRNRMGAEHDVEPEQKVNETRPVDIRVTPVSATTG
jgi:hypothetical protein